MIFTFLFDLTGGNLTFYFSVIKFIFIVIIGFLLFIKCSFNLRCRFNLIVNSMVSFLVISFLFLNFYPKKLSPENVSTYMEHNGKYKDLVRYCALIYQDVNDFDEENTSCAIGLIKSRLNYQARKIEEEIEAKIQERHNKERRERIEKMLQHL